jgi:hypothetical protein
MAYLITEEAKGRPRVTISPIHKKHQIGIGGSVTRKGTPPQSDMIVREALPDEYEWFAQRGGLPNLIVPISEKPKKQTD